MIKEIQANIFVFETDALLHSCNCQGKMGAGIALTIKEKYPEVYDADINTLTQKFGKILPVKLAPTRLHKYCFNCYTQYDYGREKRQVDYEQFYNCMEKVEFKATQLGLKTLSIPWKISCQNAGGSWLVIKSMLEDVFTTSDLEVFVCKL
jgi:O-acetyl-ADP-ribose deacetylase (regulator of RNase III)